MAGNAITDPFLVRHLQPTESAGYSVRAIRTIGVVVVGKGKMRWKIARAERAEEESSVGVLGEVTEQSGSRGKSANRV